MNIGIPSSTAAGAAAARAAHRLVDRPPLIFDDPLAESLLGDQGTQMIQYHRTHGDHLVLAGARGQVTCRSRYTEERLAECVRRGVGQYLILGAGLDTFAYRSPLVEQVRVLEVDHPATQSWKRERLADLGLAVPDQVEFLPVDFERETLGELLRGSGFDPHRPCVVSWLGVTMYLTGEAIGQTLDTIRRFAPGSELIMDYMLSAPYRDEVGRSFVEQLGAATAELGEPWLTVLAPDAAAHLVAGHGLDLVEDLDQRASLPAELWRRQDALTPHGLTHLLRARVPVAE